MAFESKDTEPEEKSGCGLNLIIGIVLIVITLAIGMIFKGKSLYARYEDWHTSGAAEKVLALINEQRWESASAALQEPLQANPNHPNLLRVVAELYAKGYQDTHTAADFQRRLLQSGKATSQDFLRMGELVLESGDLSEATLIYDRVPKEVQASRQGLELRSGILRAEGKRTEADQLLRQALSLAPDDRTAQLRLAIMDSHEAFNTLQSSREPIWKIAEGGDVVAAEALQYLADLGVNPVSSTHPPLTATEARRLKAAVEAHPTPNERLRYLMLQCYVTLNPTELTATVAAEVSRNAGMPHNKLFHYYRWLGLQKQHERILATIYPETVSNDPEIFSIYVDALSAAEQWGIIVRIIESTRIPVGAASKHLILAHAHAAIQQASRQPDYNVPRRHLQKVMELSALGEIPLLLRGAELASQLQLDDIAEKAYLKVADARPALRAQIYEKLTLLYERARDSQGLLTCFQRLREIRPNNQHYITQMNYVRLVSGIDIEIAIDEIGKSTNAITISGACPPALLQALVAWRLGQIEKIEPLINTIPLPRSLPPGQRATLAGLYQIAGRGVDGYRLAESVHPGLLLEGEMTFMQRTQ
jgi:tetratricopeptide (TPR) repeat protein